MLFKTTLFSLLLFALTTFGQVTEIQQDAEFLEVIKNKDKLVVVDLYATWCQPCKLLAPILEELSTEYPDRAAFFKLDVDKHRMIAQQTQMRGVPYVVMFKNGEIVHTITGLNPKDEYKKAIEILSGELKEEADGVVHAGVRTITIPAGSKMNNLYVYRGDNVKIVFEANKKPFQIAIPHIQKNYTSDGKKSIEAEFTATEVGSFPLFCNGKEINGGGERRGWLIVMDKKSGAETSFKEVNPTEFSTAMKDGSTLLLDVRTPNEYYEEHIKGAKLVPVQQLSERLAELDAYKKRPILIYCRSGNRSAVASKILLDNDFTNVTHLSGGIKAWKNADKPVQK